jgi:gas vesicle protein
MKIIYATITGLITGFIAAVFMAPDSGKETRKSLKGTVRKQWKDVRMAYNQSAFKLGLISEKKKADLNRKTVNAYNSKNKKASADPSTRRNDETLEKVHEKAAATKAIDSPTAKSTLRKVPVNPK